jgi:hypothetical protein
VARLEWEGLNYAINAMQEMHVNVDGVMRDMVRKGAEVVAQERKKEAERRKLRDSGNMIKNIRPVRAVKEVNGALVLTVYSQGVDRSKKTPVRNAAKEFMDHYGYKNKKATHWVDSAERKAEKPAERAMTNIWNKFIKDGGN